MVLLDVVNDVPWADNRRLAIFVILAILSLAALVGLFIYRRRRNKKS